ncbi:MAG: hypothetical protein NVSMB52_20850 [Chloroflexota bacterium]
MSIHQVKTLNIILQDEGDRETFAGLLEGAILGLELDEGRGGRWSAGFPDEEVEGHAADTSLSFTGSLDEEGGEVEGHSLGHPGTYAPRFDLQFRDIEAKAALQQAVKENRIRALELQDSDGGIARINFFRRVGVAATGIGAAAVSFTVAHLTSAQQTVHSALSIKM